MCYNVRIHIDPQVTAQDVESEEHSFVVKCRVTVCQGEDGACIAECPAPPGSASDGKTRKEAHSDSNVAIEGYLASLKRHDEPVPPAD